MRRPLASWLLLLALRVSVASSAPARPPERGADFSLYAPRSTDDGYGSGSYGSQPRPRRPTSRRARPPPRATTATARAATEAQPRPRRPTSRRARPPPRATMAMAWARAQPRPADQQADERAHHRERRRVRLGSYGSSTTTPSSTTTTTSTPTDRERRVRLRSYGSSTTTLADQRANMHAARADEHVHRSDDGHGPGAAEANHALAYQQPDEHPHDYTTTATARQLRKLNHARVDRQADERAHHRERRRRGSGSYGSSTTPRRPTGRRRPTTRATTARARQPRNTTPSPTTSRRARPQPLTTTGTARVATKPTTPRRPTS